MLAHLLQWRVAGLLLGLGATCAAADLTGPQTEQRFPPLKVPAGFKATLFACDPLIEYPSAIALGPAAGSLFVAVDYMTGLGTEIVRRSEIRLIEDTNGDGYADKSTVYADGFNSIEGLTAHAGTVYAMHAPLLTSLRDTDGDGKADVRTDLVKGLGLAPEDNPVRLHCANGLVMGHDGWLYLALGDHGCDVARAEGDRLVFHGGGILRCRPDGRDLHVFATGLRNIYDVALDDELNVFVRDNENDGGDYKIRVCHSFFGADHGYPYLYYERPDEALRPLADLGLGSSAGGICYLERQFPAEYRGNLFFCEWGRSIVRYAPARAGSSFGPVGEIEFAAGAETDPYGFKPTDLVVERDGSLIVADWADGQRPRRGRGRIYRIQFAGDAPPNETRQFPGSVEQPLSSLVKQLDSPSYFVRFQAQDEISARDAVATIIDAFDGGKLGPQGQLHAVWVLARNGSGAAREQLFRLVASHADPRVQAQAVRALADLVDPVLAQHRLDVGPGDSETASRLAGLAGGKDLRVLREIVVALGRLRWAPFPVWLQKALPPSTSTAANPLDSDAALAHAAMQSLRRSGNWSAALSWLDLPDSDPLRRIALRAAAERAIPELAAGLIARLRDNNPERRRDCADLLTRIHKQPAAWVYWGYRPPPRAPNTVAWEHTAAIEQALDALLIDPNPAVRLAVLLRMQREKIPAELTTLARWLQTERNAEAVAAILNTVRDHPREQIHPLLSGVVTARDHAPANRLAALSQLADGLDDAGSVRLLTLAAAVEDGPVLAALLRPMGQYPRLDSSRLLIGKLQSADPGVRSAAVGAISALRLTAAGDAVRRLLDDPEATVRQAAAAAMGPLEVPAAKDDLLRLTADTSGDVRRASLDALRILKEPRAITPAVAGLGDRQTHTAALELLRELGTPEQLPAVIEAAHRDPSPEVTDLTIRLLSRWSQSGDLPLSRQSELEREMAALQGRTGLLLRWRIVGPLAEAAADSLAETLNRSEATAQDRRTSLQTSQVRFAAGLDGRLDLVGPEKPPAEAPGNVWLAVSDVAVTETTLVQFLGAAHGTLHVWLDGKRLHRRDETRTLQPDSDRFEGTLREGANRLVLQIAGPAAGAAFQLRFRRKNSTAEFETLAQAALTRPGNAERGSKIFFDQTRSQCSKCHRIGEQGERIGPELTGIGNRFSRIHLIESILEPSRAVAPGFQSVAVLLQNGRVVTGIRLTESETTLTLGDNQGQKHEIRKHEIEQQQPQTQSIMPEGLTKLLTTDQFVDLIAFLASQKENQEIRAIDRKP